MKKSLQYLFYRCWQFGCLLPFALLSTQVKEYEVLPPVIYKDTTAPSADKLSSENFPIIRFKKNTPILGRSTRLELDQAAVLLKKYNALAVTVNSYCFSCGKNSHLGWDQANAVVNYLVSNKHIPASRFIVHAGMEDGECNTIIFQWATQKGSDTTFLPPGPRFRPTQYLYQYYHFTQPIFLPNVRASAAPMLIAVLISAQADTIFLRL